MARASAGGSSRALAKPSANCSSVEAWKPVMEMEVSLVLAWNYFFISTKHTSRFTINGNDDVFFGSTGVVDYGDETCSLVLDHTDAEMLVPHSVDTDRACLQVVKDLRPLGVDDELDAVFDLLCLQAKFVYALLV